MNQLPSYPLVSVALCTYNGECFIEEQLNSILAQSYEPMEIIVVDDGSSDSTIDILTKLQATDKRLQLFRNEQNLGYVKNFEKAISLCKGDFIALSDQDDIWMKDKIGVLVKNIQNHLLIYSDSELIETTGRPLNKTIRSLRNYVKGHMPEAFIFHNCVAGHTLMFRKELKSFLFPFPENSKYYHDWWIAFAASVHGSITYVDECLVKYRQHNNTSTDMLHIRIPKRVHEVLKSSKVEQKTLEIIDECRVLLSLTGIRDKEKDFLLELIESYKDRIDKVFSIKLFSFLWNNKNKLYYIPTDSTVKKASYILKESYGTVLKKAFYSLKEKLT